jgi:hypothetical protein
MILFSDHDPEIESAITDQKLHDIEKLLYVATGMHFKSFTNVEEAAEYTANLIHGNNGYEEVIQKAVDAKKLFQFISYTLHLRQNPYFAVNNERYIRNLQFQLA